MYNIVYYIEFIIYFMCKCVLFFINNLPNCKLYVSQCICALGWMLSAMPNDVNEWLDEVCLYESLYYITPYLPPTRTHTHTDARITVNDGSENSQEEQEKHKFPNRAEPPLISTFSPKPAFFVPFFFLFVCFFPVSPCPATPHPPPFPLVPTILVYCLIVCALMYDFLL